jgi:hypothetical protein
MSVYTDSIANGAKFTMGYAKLLTAGVTPAIAARKPAFETTTGSKVIDCNHPTFVFGHLSLYASRIYTLAQDEAPAAAVAPAAWSDLFKAGVECKDDPKGNIYPEWSTIWDQYTTAYDLAIAKMISMPDSFFAQPHPDAKARERFPTLGASMLFLFNNHQMMHLGQISTWRRCMGLPAAMS